MNPAKWVNSVNHVYVNHKLAKCADVFALGYYWGKQGQISIRGFYLLKLDT